MSHSSIDTKDIIFGLLRYVVLPTVCVVLVLSFPFAVLPKWYAIAWMIFIVIVGWVVLYRTVVLDLPSKLIRMLFKNN